MNIGDSMARVGIIIPAYNSERTLEYCLRSAIDQTYDDYEIVVVNDGSTDRTLEIMEKYKKLSNVKFTIIDKPNGGAASARQAGLDALDTEFVTFIDSDDFIDKDYIESLVDTIEGTNTNIANARFVNNIYLPIIKHFSFKNKARDEVVDLEKDKKYLSIMYVVTTGKLYRRDHIGITPKGFQANEDLAVNYYYYAKARHVSFNNRTKYHYVGQSDGLVKTKIQGYRWDIIQNTLLPLSDFKRTFDEKGLTIKYYSEVEQLFIKNIFQRLDDVNSKVKDPVLKQDLSTLLLDYLTLHFPNWPKNRYLQEDFKDFEMWDISSAKRNKKRVENYTPTKYDSEEQIFEEYKEEQNNTLT